MTDTNNTPNSADPQDLIDAALGSTTTPATAPKIESTPISAPEPETMPSELTEAPPLPVQPMPVATEPAPATPIMTEELPLAFAAAPEVNNPSAAPIPESLGTSAPMDAVPQVVPVSTLPIEPTKMKKKLGLVPIIASALFLLIALGGGLWGYQRYTSKEAEIALVTGCASKCKGDDACIEGCYIGTAVLLDKKPELSETRPDDKPIKTDEEKKEKLEEQLEQAQAVQSANPVFDQLSNQITQQLKNDENMLTTVGGSCGALGEGDNCANNTGTCKAGLCVSTAPSFAQYCKGLFTDLQKGQNMNASYNPCQNGTCTLTDEMAKSGCIIQRVTCRDGGQTGVACEETIAAEVNTANTPVSVNKAASCGSEQVDVICAKECGTTQPFSFANNITGKDCAGAKSTTNDTPTTVNNPSPLPSTPAVVPTLMCTGITRTPTTTPVIGDKLTFTCTGSSVPAGAVALTYKFRSAIDGGVWSSLTNKTATTTEMTINACGTYKVQCQACGTISGAVVCDPVWTGAALQ